MALNLITAAAAKPVLVADVAAQVRADLTAESTLIDLYISAVTAKAENYIKRALINQTWEYTLDYFPPVLCQNIHPSLRHGYNSFARMEGIPLPMSPASAITSIKYIDVNGVLQTLDSAKYTLLTDDPNQVIPAYGESWPEYRSQPGAVAIRYVAGYGAASSNVPEAIRAWILLNVASLYENRENIAIGNGGVIELSTMADSLIDSYRLVTF
jgi:uncharacterized phiE125 gp8 family phage protein